MRRPLVSTPTSGLAQSILGASVKYLLPRDFELSWHPESANDGQLVFRRNGIEKLRVRTSEEVLRRLSQLPRVFDAQLVVDTFGSAQLGKSALDVLVGRRLILALGDCLTTVNVIDADLRNLCNWEFASTSPTTIDLLVGDEISLSSSFPNFLARHPSPDLVGWIEVQYGRILFGPVRIAAEAMLPIKKKVHHSIRPRGIMLGLFIDAAPLVVRFLQEVFASERWYLWATSGFVLPLDWTVLSEPYKLQSMRLDGPPRSAPVSFWQAQLEDAGICSGAALTPKIAEQRAVGEARERYALSHRCSDDNSVSSLPLIEDHSNGLFFTYLANHGVSRLPEHRCTAINVADSTERLAVLEEWVYFFGTHSIANSNGAAFGYSIEDAIDAGRNEIIERHSFMASWLGIRCATKIDSSSLPTHVQLEESRISAACGVRFHWYLLRDTQSNWVVMCFACSDCAPFLSMGAACRRSLGEASSKAILEAVTTNVLWTSRIEKMGCRSFVDHGKRLCSEAPERVGLIEMGWIWAADAEGVAKVDCLLTRGESAPIDLALDRFFYVDITPPEYGRGRVVKVLHPDALPLPSSYRHLLQLGTQLKLEGIEPIPLT